MGSVVKQYQQQQGCCTNQTNRFQIPIESGSGIVWAAGRRSAAGNAPRVIRRGQSGVTVYGTGNRSALGAGLADGGFSGMPGRHRAFPTAELCKPLCEPLGRVAQRFVWIEGIRHRRMIAFDDLRQSAGSGLRIVRIRVVAGFQRNQPIQ